MIDAVVRTTPVDPQRPDGEWDVFYGGSKVTAPNKAVAEWHAAELRETLALAGEGVTE